MKPKLLYLITQGHWGGAQKYVFDLATSLADDFDITVAVGEPNHTPDLQKKLMSDQRIKVVQLNFLQRPISPIKDFLALFEIKSLYKKIKPDITHLNSTKAGILGAIFPHKKKHFVIYTVHGWVFNEPMSNFKKNIYKTMEKFSSGKKNKIIVLSEEEKSTGIQTLKIKEEKFSIIPVGIKKQTNILDRFSATKKINSILKKEVLKEDDFVYGTIANFYKTKDIPNLIEAFNIKKERLNNFKCILIGEGEEKEKIETLIKKYNLENNIFLTGFVENAETLLKAFDVFVLPSVKEGMPYTILEAKEHIIPIIATKVGSIPKIIEDKKTGLLVDPNNAQELAKALKYAFENRDEIKKMAQINLTQSLSKEEMIEKT
jgi:glycosyltransferase involved in cell wall biosynthesis